jgi:hypothetical protein
MTLFTINDIDELGQAVDKALVPLIRSNALPTIDVVGSGFLLTLEERVFFVTALHTIKDYGVAKLSMLMNGKIISVDSLDLRANEYDDICIAELLDMDLSFVTGNHKIPMDRKSANIEVPISGVLLIGFPKELNPQGIPRALPISANLDCRDDTIVESDIPNPLIYDVSGEYLYDWRGNQVMNSPKFDGMSGGPIFGWLEIPIDNECTEIFRRAFLQAVIVEWEPQHGYAVGVRVDRMVQIIDDMVK